MLESDPGFQYNRRMKTTRLITIFSLAMLLVALPAPAPVLAVDIPASAHISGISGRAQQYALSCESRSAVDLAAYYGVSISEGSFLANLPRSDNPDAGFVGDPNGDWGQIPPNPYGVHAEPVADLLKSYGLPAVDYRGLSWDRLREAVASGKPAIVWVIGRMWSGTPVSYTPSDGRTTTVARYEHTMILVGYDQNKVYVINAGNGAKETYSVSAFKNSWSVLGNMAVIVQQSGSSAPPPPPASAPSPSGTYTVQKGEYLVSIARKLGISWTDLAAVNGIKSPYVVYAGQVLKLPGGSSGGAPAPAPQPSPEPPPPPKDPPPSSGSQTYTVQRGDYLRKIAEKFGITWQSIAQANNIKYPYILYAGQVLKIPTSGESAPPPAENPPAEAPPSDAPATYTVQKGEYLVSIARKFGLNWKTLASLNKLAYPYTVYPGQVIRLR